MYRHRIVAPLVNSTLNYALWSDSRSGHFTQLRTSVPHEQEFHILRFLFCYATLSLSFPFQDTSGIETQFIVTTVSITEMEASFTLPSVVVTGMSNDGVFCRTIFLLCTPLK